jgi:hypothetical protein
MTTATSFVPLRFVRYIKSSARDWTIHRVRAAQRAIRHDREAVPLFPELARYSADDATALAQRQTEMNQFSVDLISGLRDFRAKAWREARGKLQTLPAATRAGFVRYWNQCGCPADPTYLLDQLHDYQRGGLSGWGRLRLLRQYQLAGQGKLHWSVFREQHKNKFSVRAHTWGRTEYLRRYHQRQHPKSR